jgi:hypothetical protein
MGTNQLVSDSASRHQQSFQSNDIGDRLRWLKVPSSRMRMRGSSGGQLQS